MIAAACFSAKLAALALPFASKQDPRPYLQGVCIRPARDGRGAVIQASNGHMAVQLIDRAGHCNEDAEFIVKTNVIKQAAKVGTIELSAGLNEPARQNSAWFRPSGLVIDDATIEGKFPDLYKVAPWGKLTEGIKTAGVNLDYLKAALEFFPKLSTPMEFVGIYQQETEDARNGVIVIANSERSAVVYLMPARDRLDAMAAPEWMPRAAGVLP